MGTPQFILDLRERIGHAPLWLMGVTGYVRDMQGNILLGRRSDNGRWALVSGIVEPGEEPADTIAREIKEETGVDATASYLVAVTSDPHIITYPNGDQTQYMDHLFLCEVDPVGNSEAFVGDDESLEVAWYSPDALPKPMTASSLERIAAVQEFLSSPNHAAQFRQ